MVSTSDLISNSSSPWTNPLVTVLSTPITIGIPVTFTFHNFSVLSQGPDTYLSFSFLSILLCGLAGQQSPQFSRFSFFFTITMSVCLAEIRWSVCISKSPGSLCISVSWTDSGLLLLLLFTSLRVFQTSVSWWFLTGVWVTTSLLKSPGLFSVFCPMLIKL